MKETVDLRKKIRQELAPAPKIDSGLGIGLLSWVGPLHTHNPNMKAIWSVASFLFILAGLLYFFQRNVITTIFFASMGATILVHAKKKPHGGKVEVSPFGVKINNQNYSYEELVSFWLEYEPSLGINELSLQIKKWYMPYIKIPLGDQNPVQVRSYLIQYIPEIPHSSTLADTIARRLGL